MTEPIVQSSEEAALEQGGKGTLLQWLAVVGLVYLLICAVGMIGSGFKAATGDHARELFAFATNPFAGLVVGTTNEIMHTAIGREPLAGIFSGTLVTLLVQSSSTTTSLMVPLAGFGTFGPKQI